MWNESVISHEEWLRSVLIRILLIWKIGWAPNNASKWQEGFKLAFKGLIANLNENYKFILFENPT